MDLQNLQGHHGELISFMESNGYAEAYIQRFRLAISRILSEPDPKRWSSYTDIYRDYEKKSSSPNYLKQMRTVIGAIEQFDIYGRMPDARHRHTLFERGASYKNNIMSVLKTCLKWDTVRCQRLISYLPALKKTRRNIQYLTKDEVRAVHTAIGQPSVSLRNKAVMLLLVLTGIRSSDVACLTLDSIDWEGDKIYLCQQKTGLPLELPLIPAIGNAIFDYLTQERPDTESRRLFLSETWPFSPLANNSIENIVAKTFKLAGIRQEAGSRKGTHIFRHNAASSMLENGIQQPVISKVLGHSSPQSLDAYLSADFVHLKECALDIGAFPIGKGVFPA